MQVSIVKADNQVTVDGESRTVDCSTLPANFHALQWYGLAGDVEYAMMVCEHCGTRSKKPNATITDLTPYQPYVDAWAAAKAKAEAEAAAAPAPVGA